MYACITMLQSTLTNQNQITIPTLIRKMLNLQPGDKLFFSQLPDDAMKVTKAATLEETLGVFKAYKKEKAADKKVDFEGAWLERHEKSLH